MYISLCTNQRVLHVTNTAVPSADAGAAVFSLDLECVCKHCNCSDGDTGVESHAEDYCEIGAREYIQQQLYPAVRDGFGTLSLAYICEIEVGCCDIPGEF